jgi:hypothetical protein
VTALARIVAGAPHVPGSPAAAPDSVSLAGPPPAGERAEGGTSSTPYVIHAYYDVQHVESACGRRLTAAMLATHTWALVTCAACLRRRGGRR